MKRLHILIGGLALLLILCSTRSIEGFDNKDSCDYNNKDKLDRKIAVIPYSNEKYFLLIGVKILTIKDNLSCEPRVEGKVIKISKDKLKEFNKNLHPSCPHESESEEEHKRFLENLIKNNPDLIQKILDNRKACDTHTVSDLK